MKRSLALLPFVLLVSLSMSASVTEGDRHFALRANGAQGAHAQSAEIDAAIAAYQQSVAQAPNDLPAHGRLLRAYRFKGAYVARNVEEKKKVYSLAKQAGDRALKAVGQLLVSKGVKANAPEKSIAAALRNVDGAGEIYLWDSINWGEWALAYGKIAAARQGAADRIRREATIAHLIDPALELGAPARVLGRLHDQTPRIPFLTGWASGKEALRFLKESLAYDPANKLTIVFLAEAMVSNDSGSKAQAIRMLRGAVAAPPHPQYLVEDAAAAADAQALLRKWGA